MYEVRRQAEESVQDLGSVRKVIQNLLIPVAPETIMRPNANEEQRAALVLRLFKDVHGVHREVAEQHLLRMAKAVAREEALVAADALHGRRAVRTANHLQKEIVIRRNYLAMRISGKKRHAVHGVEKKARAGAEEKAGASNVIATECQIMVQRVTATSFLPVNAEHPDGGIVALIAEIMHVGETGEARRVAVKAEGKAEE